jgi:hypothetical protein
MGSWNVFVRTNIRIQEHKSPWEQKLTKKNQKKKKKQKKQANKNILMLYIPEYLP